MLRIIRACPWMLSAPALLSAGLVRVEVSERSAVLDGKAFAAGAYERIVGKAYFAVDPEAAANAAVVNLKRAPRNAKGQVEFFADFAILAPRDPAKGNGTLLFEVSNRGRKGLFRTFARAKDSNDPRTAAEFGDGLLLDEGYLVVWLGWQFDVPREPPLMSVTVPVARNADGSPVRGLVRSDFVPDGSITRFSLADRLFYPYKVVDPADPANSLSERALAAGPRRVIPRGEWRFTSDRGGVEKPSGFESGKIYEVVYTSEDPAVTGLGMVGIRDLITALREGSAPAPLAALRSAAKRTLAFGSSQSGRFLRTFLYQGFNRSEGGRRVFDGVWANVAGGGRGNFNHQFAQPSRDARPFFNFYYATDIFPFTDLDQTDSVTGLTDGILSRARRENVVPKIFYTNSSYEYYGRAASLIHTSPDGKSDVALAPETRLYVMAGGNHGPGSLPPGRSRTTRYLNNVNDYGWVQRSLLAAMNRWLTDGQAPPASRYPAVAKGELTPVAGLRLPKREGVDHPLRLHEVYRLDFGPEFRTKGIVAHEPPKMGPAFAILVPQVDADGNDIGGIRTPQVAVPLGAHTGWNHRSPEVGASQELSSMTGSYFPFSRDEITRRYGSKAGYLEKVREAARRLAGEGYLLARDVEAVVATSSREWDWAMGPR